MKYFNVIKTFLIFEVSKIIISAKADTGSKRNDTVG